jgi:hypothetical protein
MREITTPPRGPDRPRDRAPDAEPSRDYGGSPGRRTGTARLAPGDPGAQLDRRVGDARGRIAVIATDHVPGLEAARSARGLRGRQRRDKPHRKEVLTVRRLAIVALSLVGCERADSSGDRAAHAPRLVKAPEFAKASACLIQGGAVSCTGAVAVPAQGRPPDAPPKILTRVAGIPPVTDVAITQGGCEACAVAVGGDVWCWGDNRGGAIGQGWVADPGAPDRDAVLPPSRVSGLPPVRALAAGLASFCALATDGGVWCWGSNTEGIVRWNGAGDAVPTPTQVDGIPRGVAIVATWGHACVRADDASVWCWGDAPDGEPRGPRRAVDADAVGFVQRAEFPHEICAELRGGAVTCWDAIPTLRGQDPAIGVYTRELPAGRPAP